MKKYVFLSVGVCFVSLLIGPLAFASQLLTNPKFITLNDAGVTMRGCLYTYEAGTTTKKTTYSDKTLTTANSNPIQCDSRGECNLIYFEGTLKLVMTNPSSTGTCPTDPTEADIEYTLDNLEGSGSSILDFQTCSDFTDLETAIDTIGSTETTLVIDCNATLTDNLTIPPNIHVQFMRGFTITLGNYNLTINGTMQAGPWKIFDASGTGKVYLGSSATNEIYPEWWGAVGDGVTDDTSEMQAAFDCGVNARVPVKLQRKIYLITSTLTIAGSLDIYGTSHHYGDDLASTFLFLGSDKFILTTAQLGYSTWQDFRVSTTGNTNSDIIVFDIDKGCIHNRFVSVDAIVTSAVSDCWVIRGESQFNPGVANAAQWCNIWENCKVSGNVGICWKGGNELSQGRFNNNKFIGGTTPSTAQTAFYIIGNGNSFFNVNVNKVAGDYAVVLYGAQTQDNNFFGVYFDSFYGKKIKLQRDLTADVSMANFYGCNEISSAADFYHVSLDGSTEYSRPAVNVFGSWGVMIYDDAVGNGEESTIAGFKTGYKSISLPATLTTSYCGKMITRSSGTDNTITLPEIGSGEGYASAGWWVGIVCLDASNPITVYPHSSNNIGLLPNGQPVKLAASGRYVVFEVVSGTNWMIKSTNGTIVVPISSDTTITQRGAISDIFVFTNQGATGTVTLTLPQTIAGGASGCRFMRVESYPFRIDPYGTQMFRGSSAGKYKSLDSDGAILQIRSGISTIWEVENTVGTITNEP